MEKYSFHMSWLPQPVQYAWTDLNFKSRIMKTNILLFIATFFAFTSFAQHFEGKIVYKDVYKSRVSNLTDEQLTTMLGTTREYYIKDGDYKSVFNGSFFQWLLYINSDNKLYVKFSGFDTLIWNDGATYADSILKVENRKTVTQVLGYTCDEVVLTCTSGKEIYYFNTQLSVDPKLFANHKYVNWFAYLSNAKSLPLKSIIEQKEFTVESVATSVTPMKLEKAFFALPPNAKTKEGPE
jgi:hypothetical protein